MSNQLSPEQQSQIARRIGELDQQIAPLDAAIQSINAQLPAARGKKKSELEGQRAAALEQRATLLQEANTLRGQIGLPMIIASSASVQYPATPVAVAPKKRGRGCLYSILGVVVFLVVASLLTRNNSEATTTGTTATQAPVSNAAVTAIANSPTVAATTAPSQPKIGEDVRVGDVRWRVIAAANEGDTIKAATAGFEDAKTAATFVRVRVEVENLSKEPLSFTSVELRDGQSRTFRASTDIKVFMAIPDAERCSLATLSPNIPKTCQFIFEVPTDATGMTLQAGDLAPFGDDASISLGF